MSRCRACDAEVEWAWLPSSKRIPLDVAPVVGGNMQVVRRLGSRIDVIVVGPGEGDRVTHFATCPAADEFRRT